MEDLHFLYDDKGRINYVYRENYHAKIEWNEDPNADIDIEQCNFIIKVVLTARGVGSRFGDNR